MGRAAGRLGLALMLAASPAAGAGAAEELHADCGGSAPYWRLTLEGGRGGRALLDRGATRGAPVRFEIPLVTPAEGRNWPRAYTLVGAQDTGILILDRDPCRTAGGTLAWSADLLTQEGSRAIVLTGCCRVRGAPPPAADD